MNLHAIVAPAIAAINPMMPVAVRISIASTTAADGKRTPTYATPGIFTAAIAGSTMTVSAVASGKLERGQTITGSGVAPGTLITSQVSGTAGGTGVYKVSQEQTIASEAMANALELFGQIQPMTWRDIQQLDNLNIEGVRWKIYLTGETNGLVRPERKGGDLVVVPSGPHAGTWLVAQILEQFPDWCCAALTLQNGG